LGLQNAGVDACRQRVCCKQQLAVRGLQQPGLPQCGPCCVRYAVH
jgi:hypothetical protein